MKKIVGIIITIAMLFSSVAVYAKSAPKQTKVCPQCKQVIQKRVKVESKKVKKEKKQTFKINGSPVIKYGRYKLPIRPIEKGLGAKVTYDNKTHVITVTKNAITIRIDLENKKAFIKNGDGAEVEDTKSGIFTASNSKKMTVLIKYIAVKLGARVEVDDDEVDVITPALTAPTAVIVTPVEGTVVANTLNITNTYITAAATIAKGEATGGKAELYVGAKLVATDTAIAAEDTTVTFTTSDGTPTNSELQAAIPAGGVVSVKLYNSKAEAVASTVGNPTLAVDYVAPTITSIASADYYPTTDTLTIAVTGAGAIGDIVDVTKISVTDASAVLVFFLTTSTGTVTGDNLITIKISPADKVAFNAVSGTDVTLSAANGLLKDAAQNISANFAEAQIGKVVTIH